MPDKKDEARDFDARPYSPEEKRVAQFFFDLGAGGGDDPIGAMIASHAELARQRTVFRSRLKAAGLSTDADYGDDMVLDVPKA